MSKRKFIVKNRRKRKILFSILFVVLLFIGVGYSALSTKLMIGGILDVSKSKTLYGVLENEARIGTYATEYTGEHKDSFTETGTKKIYHWDINNAAEATVVQSKNNVIFAGQCWQMIRTTDTGGVKLLYNGEVENGKCLSSRSNHVGYSAIDKKILSSTYYYGSSYSFDNSSQKFSLDGDLSTGSIHPGLYTCEKTTSTESCQKLVLVGSQVNGDEYEVYLLEKNSPYQSFGYTSFNRKNSIPSYVGYMYNSTYPITTVNNYFTSFGFHFYEAFSTDNYEYSDTVFYDNSNNYYYFNNSYDASTVTNYSDFIGKYLLYNNAHGNSVDYVIDYDSTTDKLFVLSILDGQTVPSFVIGDSYTKSNNVYTIQNSNQVSIIDWYHSSWSDYSPSSYDKKYMCMGTSDTCSELLFINKAEKGSIHYWIVGEHEYSFGSSVAYVNGEYSLSGDIITIDLLPREENIEDLYDHRYTCFNSSGTCTTMNYLWEAFWYTGYSYSYLSYNGVNSIENVLNKMLLDDDVNLVNSNIKFATDKWYEKYLLKYDSYIEDTIYCNAREYQIEDMFSNPYYVPDFADGFKFSLNYNNMNSLKCNYATEQFSINNILAQLNYKVGLPSYYELSAIDYDTDSLFRNTWTMSGGTIYKSFSQDYSDIDSFSSLRPVISLKPNTMYKTGDGSTDNPYYVGELYHIYSSSNIFNIQNLSPNGFTIDLDSNTDDYVVTSFKLNGTLVNGDSFVMPEEDVTITDIQYVQANYNITCNDGNVTVPSTGRYNSTITLVPNTGVVSSFKLNGALMEGNSFVMPAENVTITDIVIGTSVTVESAHNPYVVNLDDEVYYENTFTGATSITVELTYETDWSDKVELYDSSTAPYPTNYGGYFGTTQTTETITINSNYLKIKFTGSGSNTNYYGFRAVITPNYS